MGIVSVTSPDELSGDELANALDHIIAVVRERSRVTLVVPDLTRTLPLPTILAALMPGLLGKHCSVTILIALGTHSALRSDDVDRLVGLDEAGRAGDWPATVVVQHDWRDETTLRDVGTIDADEVAAHTDGLYTRPVAVRLHEAAVDADTVVLMGPVFPHEVAGFSGGAKYLVPGVAGAEVIDATHWIGALWTNLATIGVMDTPVRRVIHAAVDLLPRRPLACCFVVRGSVLVGAHVGDHEDAWRAAAGQATGECIVWHDRSYPRVLAIPALHYPDMWTAAKAVYKTEPVVADGGEVVVYAPHIASLSVVHEQLLREVGYHVRDYFLENWDSFAHIPGAVLAHSTHVAGTGTIAAGREQARIRVTLATGVPRETCLAVGLGHMSPASVDRDQFDLVVDAAGEVLHRVRPTNRAGAHSTG